MTASELTRRLSDEAAALCGRADLLRESITHRETDKILDRLDRATRTLRKLWEIYDEIEKEESKQ